VLCFYSTNNLLVKFYSLIHYLKSKTADLFLIDEGIIKCYSNDEIRINLPDYFDEVEPQAKHCQLKNKVFFPIKN